jgi:L,D-peptidoglycan transpeptidase YkuD (ErfK/YbiS/YcfS/YnhG family)
VLSRPFARRFFLTGILGAGVPPALRATPALFERLIVSRGELIADEMRLRCAIGHGGIRRDKAEGDGATPVGRFPLREVLYRADRVSAVETALPLRALSPNDGWCDDPRDPRYNTRIALPSPAHHEELWRTDHLYDVIVVIGYNDAPAVAGKGSAIFLHVASPNFGPTDGCVALALPMLLAVLRRCGPVTTIQIEA